MEIDVSLVRRLVSAQFPQWSNLSIRSVEPNGWDNRTFRLGNEMSVRLPSAEGYAAQVDKEHRWLPILAPQLPLAVPVPLARGLPTEEYLWNWSVNRWLDGENATVDRIDDLNQFATSLAQFLVALQRIDPANGPGSGQHNFFRGGPLATYDQQTRDAIRALRGEIDTESVTRVWNAALAAKWSGVPVWVHGDVHPTNLLVCGGRLCSVIDFGCLCVGDPACDLTIAYTFFPRDSRRTFRKAMNVDASTWARCRGWALWKGLITISGMTANTDSYKAAKARQTVDEVLADYKREA